MAHTLRIGFHANNHWKSEQPVGRPKPWITTCVTRTSGWPTRCSMSLASNILPAIAQEILLNGCPHVAGTSLSVCCHPRCTSTVVSQIDSPGGGRPAAVRIVK